MELININVECSGMGKHKSKESSESDDMNIKDVLTPFFNSRVPHPINEV